tara:strand:+ start:173 stop:409 length:237 start_codon:yes stop_codon:yes gene_type:complete
MKGTKEITSKVSWLHLEGTPVHIDWWAFQVGTSFFLPCCHCTSLQNEIARKAKIAGVVIACKIEIKNNVKGLRTWRLD